MVERERKFRVSDAVCAWFLSLLLGRGRDLIKKLLLLQHGNPKHTHAYKGRTNRDLIKKLCCALGKKKVLFDDTKTSSKEAHHVSLSHRRLRIKQKKKTTKKVRRER